MSGLVLIELPADVHTNDVIAALCAGAQGIRAQAQGADANAAQYAGLLLSLRDAVTRAQDNPSPVVA